MGGTRPSVFETPRTGDHGSGEGGFAGVFFEGLSFGSRRVVDAAGEASRFVERFAGDVSSARWSRSRLACASTWILSLRISSRASLRLVWSGGRNRSGDDASKDERDGARDVARASRTKPRNRARVFGSFSRTRSSRRSRAASACLSRCIATTMPACASAFAATAARRRASARSRRSCGHERRVAGQVAVGSRAERGRAPRAGTKQDAPSRCAARVPGSRSRAA